MRSTVNETYVTTYPSPLGTLTLAADKIGLIGLWFKGQAYFGSTLSIAPKETALPIFDHTKHWLDLYFSGKAPDFLPPLHLIGTDFQKQVWQHLLTIPYGKTMTYGEIAHTIAAQRKIPRMSAQAVGNAVGHNPIGILIPCHRILGASGALTGYAGGIERKRALLRLEGIILNEKS